jgi:hypothetical protein
MTGLQISLAVGAHRDRCVSLVIGVAWGAIAGFAGGRVDQYMMRIVDVLYAVPVHLLRHPRHRRVRALDLPDLPGHRRGRVDDHGAHRARTDAGC